MDTWTWWRAIWVILARSCCSVGAVEPSQCKWFSRSCASLPHRVRGGRSDGDRDVIVRSRVIGDTLLFEDVDGRTFASPVKVGSLDSPSYLVLADADRDGDMDVHVARGNAMRLEQFVGDGAGGFMFGQEISLSVEAYRLFAVESKLRTGIASSL